jgi:hypothetical protein
MVAVRSIKNQYRGLNAHVHSLWQSRSGWSGFHTVHIGYLLRAFRAELRALGYTADAEQSLQIRRVASPVSEQRRADVMLYDLNPARSFQPAVSSPVARPRLTVADVLDENQLDEKPFRAIVIYERVTNTGQRGEAVAWVELLSPTNKGESTDADTYQRKRRQLLDRGLVFVELDYLHETPPTFRTISPVHPYRIIVLDPRPSLDKGPAEIAEFNVDEPVPTMNIPLNGDDVLTFDFNAPYQRMFEEVFYGDDLDYSQLPEHFERYNLADRQRIANRMLATLRAAQAGLNLETGAPLPIEELLPLEAALAKLKSFT